MKVEDPVQVVIATAIASVEGEPGLYIVDLLFDGVPERFHVELDRGKSSFVVQEHSYYAYCERSRTLKGFVALMRKWHRGERCRLPVDLAEVDFGKPLPN